MNSILKYENNDFKFWIQEDIFFIKFKQKEVDLAMVEEGIKKRIEMMDGKSYPMLSDVRDSKTITRDARARMAQKDAGIGLYAVAILSNSKAHRVMLNFLMSIYEPKTPTKMFAKNEDAISWLQQYIKKE